MEHPAQQYYNPDLTADEERALLRRNYLVLMVGQAALGLIGPGITGIAVEAAPGRVVVHVAADQASPELTEDVDDILGELEGFLLDGPEQNSEIAAELHLGPTDSSWLGRTHALVYLAKR